MPTLLASVSKIKGFVKSENTNSGAEVRCSLRVVNDTSHSVDHLKGIFCFVKWCSG